VIGCAFKGEMTALKTHLFDSPNTTLASLNDGLKGYLGKRGNNEIALVLTGIGMRRAREAMRIALKRWPAPEFILSTGVAGALSPDLAIGAIVLADSVMTCHFETGLPEHILGVAREQREAMDAALANTGKSARAGAIFTSTKPLTTVAAKSRAAELSGAVAVDMESAAIALEAATRGIPYVCLRTILDTANEDVMGAELADENGRVRLFAAARAMVRNPAILTSGLRLLRNLRVATKAMGEAVAAAIGEPVLSKRSGIRSIGA
jgi:nucleoside phosphorylase